MSQSQTTDDTHATPPEDAWTVLAAEAHSRVEADNIIGFGPVQEGAMGAYAARRVFFEGRHGASSALIVAADERLSDGTRGLRVGGTVFRPYAVYGCYGCGPKCPRHGPEYPR